LAHGFQNGLYASKGQEDKSLDEAMTVKTIARCFI